MGRSLASLSAGTVEPAPATRAHVAGAGSNHSYEVERRADGLYQTEIFADVQGHETLRRSYRLLYVIGMVNGAGYLVERGGYLFEAPLSWYPRKQAWGLSPGYQNNDSGFSRPVEAGCVFCHSGRPQPAAERAGLFEARPFLEEAVGCENCHGPGLQHAIERGKGTAVPPGGDTLIVNPARLTPALGRDICMTCHQGADARVLMPGKGYADFRPGTPLAETLALFKLPARPGQSPESEVLEHDFSMRFSKCFTATRGKLVCQSCHDPHASPAGERKTAFYREKCLQCHQDSSCTLPATERAQRNQNDCTGCHMERRDLTTFSHSALTNHRIVRKPGQPYPDSAYRLTTAALPDLVYVDAPAGPEKSLPAITLLSAYQSLAPGDAHYRERYLSVLLDLVNHGVTNDPTLLAAVAAEAQADRTPDGDLIAIRYWTRALETGRADSRAYSDLGGLLLRAGRTLEAAGVLEKCTETFPFAQACSRALLDVYAALGKTAQFGAVARRYLELFPEDAVTRKRIGDKRP